MAEPGSIAHRPSGSRGRLRVPLGTIVQALTDTGRLGDTMIVFASDNGLAWGEHRWTKKATIHEDSIRVPLVIRYDPLVAGPVTDGHLVANIDLAPTWAEAAGVPAPGAEGTSLFPLLTGLGGAAAWRTEFLIEHIPDVDEGAFIPSYCAVRDQRFTHASFLTTGEEEL